MKLSDKEIEQRFGQQNLLIDLLDIKTNPLNEFDDSLESWYKLKLLCIVQRNEKGEYSTKSVEKANLHLSQIAPLTKDQNPPTTDIAVWINANIRHKEECIQVYGGYACGYDSWYSDYDYETFFSELPWN